MSCFISQQTKIVKIIGMSVHNPKIKETNVFFSWIDNYGKKTTTINSIELQKKKFKTIELLSCIIQLNMLRKEIEMNS